MFTRLPIMPQDVKKRENKARTFAPPDNTTKSTKIIDPLKSADKDREEQDYFLIKRKFFKILILINY